MRMDSARPPEYSLVVPVYNEEETLPELARLASLLDRMDGECEVILVDDGSSDSSYELMAAVRETDARFKLLRLRGTSGIRSPSPRVSTSLRAMP